jgi:hypothetical protein
MKPRTTLILTLLILLLSYVGARLYVGQQLDSLQERQLARRDAPPPVNVVAPVPPPSPADATPPPPSPGELAVRDVENAFNAFTSLQEWRGEDRDAYIAESIATLQTLGDRYAAVPEDHRAPLATSVASIAGAISDDAPVAREAVHDAWAAMLTAWGQPTDPVEASRNE